MGDLFLLTHHHAATPALLVGLCWIAAVFTGRWTRQGLRNGVTRLGDDLWVEVSRAATPRAYWLSIASQALLTAAFALVGVGVLAWSFIPRS